MAKQKVRKCLTPFFYAETIKAVLIPFNTPHTVLKLWMAKSNAVVFVYQLGRADNSNFLPQQIK